MRAELGGGRRECPHGHQLAAAFVLMRGVPVLFGTLFAAIADHLVDVRIRQFVGGCPLRREIWYISTTATKRRILELASAWMEIPAGR